MRICPACLEQKEMTKHHVYPKRHFGKNAMIFELCRACHDKLEKYIKKAEIEILSEEGQLPDFFYVELLFKFISLSFNE